MRDRINFRVGSAIAGLGMFFLHGELAGAAIRLTNILGANGSHELGVLPAAILTILQASHTQVSHTAGLAQHILLSCWPLLLVTVGAALSRNPAKQNNLAPGKKIVDLSI